MAKKSPVPRRGIYGESSATTRPADSDWSTIGRQLVATYSVEPLVSPVERAALAELRKYRTRKPDGKYRTADVFPHDLPASATQLARIARAAMFDLRSLRLAVERGDAAEAAAWAFRVGVRADRLGVITAGFDDIVAKQRKADEDLADARKQPRPNRQRFSDQQARDTFHDSMRKLGVGNAGSKTTVNQAIEDAAAKLCSKERPDGVSPEALRKRLRNLGLLPTGKKH